MRICVLTPTSFPLVGGVETAIDQLVRAWRDAGHEAVVLAQRPRHVAIPADGPDHPLRYFARPLTQRGGYLAARRALSRWHRELGFDVVHAQMAYPAGWIAVHWGRACGVPAVVTCQGGDVSATSRFRQRPLIRGRLEWALEHAAAATAVSEELAAAANELSPRATLQVVPNGVDPDIARPATAPEDAAWWPRVADRPFLLYLKRLHPAKGHDLLLDAFARGRADLPAGMQLVCAGAGTERDPLLDRARVRGIEDAVVFPGEVQGDARRWLLQQCRAFVHPSRREGMPVVILEAMACGRAVLAARAEGIASLVVPGETGLILEPEDARAWTSGLGALLELAARPSVGEAARRHAAAFHWSRVAARYLELFEELRSR